MICRPRGWRATISRAGNDGVTAIGAGSTVHIARKAGRAVVQLALGGLLALLVLAFVRRIAGHDPLVVFALAAVGGLACWFAVSVRYEISLGFLAAYMGLFDGYLKLKLNNNTSVLGRDVLL